MHHAVRGVAQVGHAERIVGAGEGVHRFLDRRRLGVVPDRELHAVGGGQVGAALHVVPRYVHFVRGERVDEITHARGRVLRVLRFRKTGHYLLERLERFARGLRVAVRHVRRGEKRERPALQLVEVDQPLQVVGVVDVRMIRIQLDEAIRGGDRQGALAVLVLRIRHLELRLLREAAVGIARFQLFQVLDGFRPFLGGHRVLRFAIEALGRPADRLVLLRRGKQSAAG